MPLELDLMNKGQFQMLLIANRSSQVVLVEKWSVKFMSHCPRLIHSAVPVSEFSHLDLNLLKAQGVSSPEMIQSYCEALEAGQEMILQLFMHSPLAFPSIICHLDFPAEGLTGSRPLLMSFLLDSSWPSFSCQEIFPITASSRTEAAHQPWAGPNLLFPLRKWPLVVRRSSQVKQQIILEELIQQNWQTPNLLVFEEEGCLD